VHFVIKICLHFWNLRKKTDFFIPNMTHFDKKKISALFSRFLTFWENKSPFQRLESRLKILLKSYLMFTLLSNNDSAPFFLYGKKVKYWRWLLHRWIAPAPRRNQRKITDFVIPMSTIWRKKLALVGEFFLTFSISVCLRILLPIQIQLLDIENPTRFPLLTRCSTQRV
jgi:hypothetical protein